MKTSLSRVMIMAGGTGGHIFPGLALADALRERQIDVQWLGTKTGLEARLVSEHGFPLSLITVSGLRGKGVKAMLRAPFQLCAALYQSIRLIRRLKPDVVVGMGGFVSGPGGFAAWLLGYPVLVHEQNAKAGLTNKLLAVFARRVLQAFPDAFPVHRKVMTIGNPVRRTLESLPSPDLRSRQHDRLHLLVLGGSLGAQAINELLPKALATLPPERRPVVLHQAGEKHFEATKALYAESGVDATVKPFLNDMAKAYAFADVVLCRAGALTVSELCSVGLGAIFIPFPHAVDDHQTANANFMVKEEAAICIQQSAATTERLANELKRFIDQPDESRKMAKKAYALRHIGVASQIADICKEVLN